MRKIFYITLVVLLTSGLLFVFGCYTDGFQKIYLRLWNNCVVEYDITYQIVDNVNLKMDIFHPFARGDPVPAIVYIHGGGWYSGDKTHGEGLHDIPYLVSNGYLVASIDYRLAPRFKFPAQIEDVRSAIHFLRVNSGTYGIDVNNIGVFGDSAGGHLAVLAGVTNNDVFECSGCGQDRDCRVQAVVDMYGPTDLYTFYENVSLMHMEHVFGTPDRESALIKDASPVTYVSGDDPPFLIIHGDEDTKVPLEQSTVFYERLTSTGVPATLMVVNDCGHGLSRAEKPTVPTRTEITDAVLNFFNEYLKLQAPCVQLTS